MIAQLIHNKNFRFMVIDFSSIIWYAIFQRTSLIRTKIFIHFVIKVVNIPDSGVKPINYTS